MLGDLAPAADGMLPFQLERSGIRGRFVRLGPTIDEILTNHEYPLAIGEQLGQMLLFAGGLAGGLKFDGTFSLQVKGDGIVRMMVADCSNDGRMRGYASYNAARLGADDRGLAIFGKALLALSVDQTRVGGEIQQGIVSLEGTTLVDSMLTYFRDSEQIRTGIKLALLRDPASSAWRGGAILLQALPRSSAQTSQPTDDLWNEAMMFLATVSDAELALPSLAANDVLFSLFHEHGVRVYPTVRLRAQCSCSEVRVMGMLRTFTPEALDEMRLEHGGIEVSCQFCNRQYALPAEALDELAAAARH